jgi:hypothetical protein
MTTRNAPAEEGAPMDEGQDNSPSTADFPIDYCGETPPNPGDIIQSKVISVDADSGTFTAACVQKPSQPNRGIKAAVAASAPMEDN